MRRDSSPQYWDEYTNLQYTKHMLIREYLKGWFPKLGFWSDRVVYLDTHAGRGEHKQGQAGSPIVALETLLQHSFRDKIPVPSISSSARPELDRSPVCRDHAYMISSFIRARPLARSQTQTLSC